MVDRTMDFQRRTRDKKLCLLVYLISFVPTCVGVTPYNSHVQNYVSLVSAYTQDSYSTVEFLPISNVEHAMSVGIGMSLFAINGFNEVAGNIELVASLNMNWTDEMSTIRSIKYNIQDRDSLLVPPSKIWVPKLVLSNAIGETSDVGDEAYFCRFDMHTFTVNWNPRVLISGSCTPDVTYYPFDKQTCEFVYTAWGFRADELVLKRNTDEFDQNGYSESGEWTIDTTSTEDYEENNQSFVKFKLSIIRKPLYFAFNILLPVLVLCLLNSTVFLLPAESGERVGFSVTCFLSFVVLLNMIMDIMPRSSSPISFLCYYLVVMMSNSGAMTLVTILLMRIYHKPEKSEVPTWLQKTVTFINCGCAHLLCCVVCCRFLRRQCCCPDKRYCGCRNKKIQNLEDVQTELSVDKSTESLTEETEINTKDSKSRLCPNLIVSCCKVNEDDETRGCVIGYRRNKKSDQSSSTDEVNGDETKMVETRSNGTNCFGCFKKVKVSIVPDEDSDPEALSEVRKENKGTGNISKTIPSGLLGTSVGNKKSNTLDPIFLNGKECEGKKGTKKDTLQTKSATVKLPKPVTGRQSPAETETSEYINSEVPSDMERENIADEMQNENETKNKKSNKNKQRKRTLKDDSKFKIDEKPENKVIAIPKAKDPLPVPEIQVVDDHDDDSLANIEEEVSWGEVGRVLDTFFLLAFAGGQAFFTVVFLVPLFTANQGDTAT